MDTDNKHGGAEPSPASVGSQPVAWAVIEWDGDTFGTYRTEKDARQVIEYFSYDGMHAVPLYRQPQPILTDEERQAIERLCEAANDIISDDRTVGGSHWKEDEAAVALARGILKRTQPVGPAPVERLGATKVTDVGGAGPT